MSIDNIMNPANTLSAISNIPAFPSTEWVLVTPAKAEELLGKNVGNRNKRNLHIGRLVRDMQDGNFLITGDTVKFDWDGRLVDGQHRLTAIINSGVSAWMLVVRGLDPKVQSVLDAGAKRSAYDALGFNGVTEARIILAAMAKIALTRETGRMSTALDAGSFNATNSEIVDWYMANPDAEWAAKFSVRIARQIGATPAITAYSALLFSRIDADACIEFFESAAEMRTTGDGDPRLTLLRTLERDRANRGRQNNAAQLSYFIRAWNAWREGRKISKLPREAAGRSVTIPEPK